MICHASADHAISSRVPPLHAIEHHNCEAHGTPDADMDAPPIRILSHLAATVVQTFGYFNVQRCRKWEQNTENDHRCVEFQAFQCTAVGRC